MTRVQEMGERGQRITLVSRAVVLADGARLEIRQPLDARWRAVLSLRGRTTTYTERVHALILFLARLRVGRSHVRGSEDGWAPYEWIARVPGWEQCSDKQRLREALLHEFDLVTGHFFQRSTLDGQMRIRVAQPPETIVLDGDLAIQTKEPTARDRASLESADDGQHVGIPLITVIFGQRPDRAVREITLADGSGVVIGRSPDSAAAGLDVERIDAVTVNSPNVSSSHLAAWREQDTLRLCDLGTRNGTWLRLPPHTVLSLPATSCEIELAVQPGEDTPMSSPEDAAWSEPLGFADGVAAAVRIWLAQLGIAAEARIVPIAQMDWPTADGVERCPLANDVGLVVAPTTESVDSRWHRTIEQLRRYVTEQKRRFSALMDASADGLLLASPGIRAAFARVEAAARRGARVLLIGPSGSGKEGLARCYHRQTERQGPFVSINCALFSKDLLRSELFGAERGAFTGSVQRITGAVERADAGTLFLDEIGELSLEVQPQLLRFLDSGEYQRLGQFGAPYHADVRIVCATNRDLRDSTVRGEFRLDLWYRLAEEIVEVPALRDRPDDIRAYLQTRSTQSISIWDRLTADAVTVVLEHQWEGNFRELMSFAARFHDGDSCIDADACREQLSRGALRPTRAPGWRPQHDSFSTWGTLAEQAAMAFFEDFGHGAKSWDDLKSYIEQYLKPLLFAHLSGADSDQDDIEPRQLANRINADRGTAYKQLARYRERFKQ